MQGQKLNQVEEFKYIGSIVQSDGGSDKETAKRIQAVWSAWRRIIGVLCDRQSTNQAEEYDYGAPCNSTRH